jgi:hypothetical protein
MCAVARVGSEELVARVRKVVRSSSLHVGCAIVSARSHSFAHPLCLNWKFGVSVGFFLSSAHSGCLESSRRFALPADLNAGICTSSRASGPRSAGRLLPGKPRARRGRRRREAGARGHVPRARQPRAWVERWARRGRGQGLPPLSACPRSGGAWCSPHRLALVPSGSVARRLRAHDDARGPVSRRASDPAGGDSCWWRGRRLALAAACGRAPGGACAVHFPHRGAGARPCRRRAAGLGAAGDSTLLSFLLGNNGCGCWQHGRCLGGWCWQEDVTAAGAGWHVEHVVCCCMPVPHTACVEGRPGTPPC